MQKEKEYQEELEEKRRLEYKNKSEEHPEILEKELKEKQDKKYIVVGEVANAVVSKKRPSNYCSSRYSQALV